GDPRPPLSAGHAWPRREATHGDRLQVPVRQGAVGARGARRPADALPRLRQRAEHPRRPRRRPGRPPRAPPPDPGAHPDQPRRGRSEGPERHEDDRPRERPVSARTSGLAIVSLVLGVASLGCLWLFAGLPAILLGVISLVQIGRSQGRVGGRGLAIAGILLSCLSACCCPVVGVPGYLGYDDASGRTK